MNDINLSFNLDRKAEAVLKMLEDYFEYYKVAGSLDSCVAIQDLQKIRIRTSPLYNCRERGICLLVNVYDNPTSLLIFFAGHRNSDSLFVWWNERAKSFINPPTIEDFSDESYDKQIRFFGDKITKAAEFICEKINEFYQRCT